MAMKKKIFLSAVAFYLLSASMAYAQLDIQLNLGQPAYIASAPVYAPVYVAPYPTYYDPHHRNHDYGYWQGQRRAQQHGGNGGHEARNDDHRNR